MSKSKSFFGFCVFCYRKIHTGSNTTSSSEKLNTFTKFVGELTGHNIFNKLIPADGEDKLETLSNLKLQCCSECTSIIDGFCSYYHQLKVLELKVNWKLEQLAEIIKHCNRVPSRWTNMNTSLEKKFPDNVEIRLKTQAGIRKYRSTIEETWHKILLRKPRVLLETNKDVTKTPSHLDGDSELNNDDAEINAKCSNQSQSAVLIDPTIQVKHESCSLLSNSDDADIEMPIGQHTEPDTNSSNEDYIQIDPTTLLPKTSVQEQRCSLKNKRRFITVKLETTQFRDDNSDEEFAPELNMGTSDNDSIISDNPKKIEIPKQSRFIKRKKPKLDKSSDSELFQCPKCDKSIQGFRAFGRHINSKFCSKNDHDETGSFSCVECDLLCPTKKELWKHRSCDHEVKICLHCGKEFKRRKVLLLHIVFHLDPKEWQYDCLKCGRKCPTKSNLKLHSDKCKVNTNGTIATSEPHLKTIETEPKNNSVDNKTRQQYYRCNECKCNFLNFKIFHNHVNSHVKGEFQCEFCPHKETNVLKLSIHEYQNHSSNEASDLDQNSVKTVKSRKWICPRCKIDCSGCVEYQLHFAQEHIKLKDGKCVTKQNEASVKCEECGKTFSAKFVLNRHIRDVHAKGDFSCKICGNWFPCLLYLNKHLVRKHNETIDKSRGKDKSGRNDKKIGRSKELICSKCGKIMQTNRGLRKHMQNIHSGKTSICSICGKVFVCLQYLNSHIEKVHNEDKNEKKWECAQCHKKFGFKHVLQRHEKIHKGDKD